MRVDFGEWMPDQPDLDNSATEALNVYSQGNRYKPLPNIEFFSDALPDRAVGALSTSTVAGVQRTYAATATELYELSNFSWAPVSQMAYTASEPPLWNFVQYGRNVLAASYETTLQYVDFVAGGNFADVTDGPKARYMASVRDFVMVGNINDPTDGDVPNRVQWSAIDDPLDWPLPGTDDAFSKQSDFQDLDAEDGAVVSVVGFEFAIIFQERSITRASYVGSPLVFQFDKIDATHGALTDGSIARSGQSVYFISSNGFYVTDGSGEAVPIGHGKVDKFFFDALDFRRKDEIRSISDPSRKIIIWIYPTVNSGEFPDEAIIYSYVDQRWSRASITASLFVQARTIGYTLEELDAFGDLDSLGISLDSVFWEPGVDSAFAFGPDGRLGLFGTTFDDCVISTGEFSLDGSRSFLSGVRPIVNGSDASMTVRVRYRQLPNTAGVWTGSRPITAATGKADFRVSAFYQLVETTISGGFDDVVGVDALTLPEDSER